MDSLLALNNGLSAAMSAIMSSPTLITALLAVTLVPLLLYVESLGKNPPTRPPVASTKIPDKSGSPEKSKPDKS